MFYTEEEVSVITGLLNAYLVREHASEKVRESYTRISEGLQSRVLTRNDYVWLENALLFLRPYWWSDREDGRMLMDALLHADTGTENVIKIDEGCIARYTLHFLFGSIPCFTSFEHLVGDHRRADEIGRINFQCIRNIEEHIQREVVCRSGRFDDAQK